MLYAFYASRDCSRMTPDGELALIRFLICTMGYQSHTVLARVRASRSGVARSRARGGLDGAAGAARLHKRQGGCYVMKLGLPLWPSRHVRRRPRAARVHAAIVSPGRAGIASARTTVVDATAWAAIDASARLRRRPRPTPSGNTRTAPPVHPDLVSSHTDLLPSSRGPSHSL